MRKKQQMVLYSLVVLLSFFSNGVTAYGVEGQATTGGKISFYEESTDSSTSSSSSSTGSSASSSVEQSSSSTRLPSTSNKPTGKLPSTGEIIRSSGIILGVLLLLLALILFLRKRKKGDRS